ncbi:MAG: L,D-transpeptidase family protein [Clostridiales bacterium]|nr:L,D-transpeptidase family protein [Clostridiales bacterium]
MKNKRYFALFIIVLMCMLVVAGGIIIFIRSDSVFKRDTSKSSYYIFVDITVNRLYLYKGTELVKSYPIASGKPKTPSPIGEWKIVNKDTWGEGFGGRWMGFNVPWGKYGIHGTSEPWSIGRDESEGCIRMFNKDVAELYKIVPIGITVKIYGGPYGPFGEGFRIIRPGDRGADVYEVQKLLKQKGYFKGYVNGIYGEDTKIAVHNFQKKNGLKITNDVGYSFYEKLGVKLMD